MDITEMTILNWCLPNEWLLSILALFSYLIMIVASILPFVCLLALFCFPWGFLWEISKFSFSSHGFVFVKSNETRNKIFTSFRCDLFHLTSDFFNMDFASEPILVSSLYSQRKETDTLKTWFIWPVLDTYFRMALITALHCGHFTELRLA